MIFIMVFKKKCRDCLHNSFWIQFEDVSLLIVFKYDHGKHIIFVF